MNERSRITEQQRLIFVQLEVWEESQIASQITHACDEILLEGRFNMLNSLER
jgi:hypothetical protein